MRHPILLTGIIGLASLLGFELALRLSRDAQPGLRFHWEVPAQSGRWVNHPFLPIAGGASGVFDVAYARFGMSEHVSTNSYGFATHEFPERKEPGDYVVICLGDAATFTYAELDDHTWMERLETLLAERYRDRRVRVFNLGSDLATSAVSVATLALVGAHLRGDLVIVYQGTNDLAAIGTSDFRPDHSHVYQQFDPAVVWGGSERYLPVWMMSSYVVAFALGAPDTSRLSEIDVLVRRPRQEGPDRFSGIEVTLENLNTIHSIVTGQGGDVLFSTFAFLARDDPAARRFNESLRHYFEQRNFAYVDQAALLPAGDPTVQMDDVRYTAKGNALLSQHFFEAIERRGLVR